MAFYPFNQVVLSDYLRILSDKLLSLYPENKLYMTIAKQIKETIRTFPDDYVFGADDFDFTLQQRQAVSKTLQRMVRSGEISTLAKGKYFKPRQTIFGSLKPSPAQIAKEFIFKNGKRVGYMTGVAAFSQFSLTTQISSKIQIGTKQYRHPIKRNGYDISFIVQPNEINDDNVDVLCILDCLRYIKRVPATTTSEACKRMISVIAELPEQKKTLLVQCAMEYSASVRALCGAVVEYVSNDETLTEPLRRSLSGATKYRYDIPSEILPTSLNWRIYEPARK